MPKSVLIISYFFPPVGGAGVQRATKFTKYLPDYDWTPIVLTVANPSVPLFDESLLKEIPDNIQIVRAESFEPGYQTKQAVSASSDNGTSNFSFRKLAKKMLRTTANLILQPDPQVLWLPRARREACRLLREKKIDVIFATAPPFSSLILGAYLSRKFKVPLILDYRDEWDISNSVWENKNLGGFSLAVQKRMQNFALRHASAVIATTGMSAANLGAKVAKLNSSSSIHTIYNGYDAQDFIASHSRPARRNEKYLLSYVGTLWNLTSIAPLIAALKELSNTHPELASIVSLAVAGRKTADQEAMLDELHCTSIEVIDHAYLSHQKAVDLMLHSDGLCLLLSDMDMAGRVVPAKIFEYLATRNNIIAIAPKGEVWKILADYSCAFCVEPGDIESLAGYLVKDIRRFQSSRPKEQSNFNIEKYERRTLTGDLAEIMDGLS